MANISSYLTNILNAIYGKDVRQSIHDGIKKINEEVESNVAAEAGRVSSENARVIAENERKLSTTDALARIETEISNSEEGTQNSQQATAEAINTTSNMQVIINDMNNKIASDYYRGEQGIKGDKGDRGDSGIIIPTSGMFTLTGDEEGNLYADYIVDESPPNFEVDVEGNIFYLIEE